MKGVEVRFKGPYSTNSDLYSYKCMFAQVKIGDMVVVEFCDSFGLASVEVVCDTPARRATRHVVAIVDTGAFDDMLFKVEKVAALEAALANEVREHLAKKQYEDLAKENPAIAAILEQLGKLKIDVKKIS